MDINARRRTEPFKPGERVRVWTALGNFEPGAVHEIKSGPTEGGSYEVWKDSGPARYELVHDRYLTPADVED